MVREIVHIQTGQCGNQIGIAFWETVSKEHGLNTEGFFTGEDEMLIDKINVYYNEIQVVIKCCFNNYLILPIAFR